ncbi:penicillin amidase [Rhodovulum iodosum]|uniref:Penicillin amidase n=1 Tax=Rhodovulum iodosum TaxID=68291 RepID=A0ABV3XUF8_9RHOB|nr:penicillin acylase family protein [Rhodovulum robiginosum]RSK35029.1 penicillin acylase family protein [Rhodovulum robiginosum]
MPNLFRWLLRLFFGIAFLVVGVLGVGYYLASRSLPDYDATYRLDGVSAPVEIVRNNSNVPHIFGETDEDVFFGLGFVHAQDRLWQMTLFRRTVQGKLSEAFGARAFATDDLMRRMDLYGASLASVAAQDEATKRALAAYAAGVNAWIDTVNREALGRGAPEFFMFSSEIAPWTPADSIAVMKLTALQIASQSDREVLRARLSLLLDDDRVRDIMPDAPGRGVAELPDYAALFPDLPAQRPIRSAALPDPFSPIKGWQNGSGSNAWAAAPDRSAAGAALLANDPHLDFTAPGKWYLARLELSDGGVIGATIPGIPAVMSGRSADLGWGITLAYLDDADLYIEKLNPDNPEEVLTPEGYKPLETRRSIIRVKDADPVTITLRRSENGPVLPGRHGDLAAITPPGHVVSLARTLFDPSDTTMTAALRLMRAHSVDEGQAAGELFVAPAVNLILADRSHIALQMVGRMPRRDPAHQSKGRLPSAGWHKENRWRGYLPYSANPRFVDPGGGIVGNTNNKTVERPFPNHVSYDWGDTQRIERWRRLMQNRKVHTRDSFIEAQLDTVSFTARSLLPLVGRDLWFTGEPAPEGTPERRRQRALLLLANWNGEMSEHLPEPLIYAAWMRALQDRLIRDDLGPLADAFIHVDPVFIERVFRDVEGAGDWCDVMQSTARETCTDMARLALDDALIWIDEHHGGALESLRWGDAHQALHDHLVLGDTPLLKWVTNIRQSTSGGDNTLMRGLTAGTGPDPFTNVHGPGYRGVYDFADPDSSVFVTATGQSGHPLSRHYDDLGELWRRGEYVPMSLDPELARAASVGVTRLLPEGGAAGQTD